MWDGVAGQWARLAARLDGAGVASLDDVAARAPAGAGPRAVPGDLRRRADGRGAWTAWRPRPSCDDLERRFAAFLRAIAAGDRRRWRPGRDRGGAARSRRARRSSGWPSRAADADFARSPRRVAAGTPIDRAKMTVDADRRHGLDRRDRAALLAWMALSHTGALAPGADVAATSLAWYDELRLPTPWSAACTTPGSARARPGP